MAYTVTEFVRYARESKKDELSLKNSGKLINNAAKMIAKIYQDSNFTEKGNEVVYLMTDEKKATSFQLYGLNKFLFGTCNTEGIYFLVTNLQPSLPSDTTPERELRERMGWFLDQTTKYTESTAHKDVLLHMFASEADMLSAITILYGTIIERDSEVWEKVCAYQEEKGGSGLKKWKASTSSAIASTKNSKKKKEGE